MKSAAVSLVVVAFCWVSAGNRAHADTQLEGPPEGPIDDQAERFAAATELMADGSYEEAAELLIAIAEETPAGALASDALFSAAKLLEERLSRPDRALALYQRLLERFPDSRTALAARRRADSLRAQIGPDSAGAALLARFNQILQGFPSRAESESIELMEELLAEQPDWTGRARALLWLASVHQRAERLDRAMSGYLEAAEAAEAVLAKPAGEAGEGAENPPANAEKWLFEAYRGAGDVAVAQGRFDRAEMYYRRMVAGSDSNRQRMVSESLDHLATEQLRTRLYWVALAMTIAVFLGFLASLRLSAGSWRAALGSLRSPPPEVIFMFPIAALLISASLASHHSIGPAVAIICAGGIALAWLSGAALLAAQEDRRARGTPGLLALAAGRSCACRGPGRDCAVLHRIAPWTPDRHDHQHSPVWAGCIGKRCMANLYVERREKLSRAPGLGARRGL